MVKAPSLVQHKRYKPIQANTSDMTIFKLGLCFMNNPMIGTMTIYMAVIKPALPADAYINPYCCALEAMAKTTPHTIPPMTMDLFQWFLPGLGWVL